MAENIESAEKIQESKEKNISLATLPVKAIDGIDKEFSAKLNKISIITIEDLVNCNAEAISEEAKITFNKVIEYQKKAELLLQLVFDKDILDPLIEKNYTIEQAVEEDLENMIKITNQDVAHIKTFMGSIREISIYLDVETCRNTPVSILPRGKVKLEDVEAKAHFLWLVEIALIIAFITTLTMTITYALILL
ncbi:MAG: hypothetical protein ACFFD2_05195 [Promethearchaeota archaeon]